MQESNQPFDCEGFYAALDAQRQAKRLTWKQIANQTGVAASTLTRMGQGKRPDVDGLAALAGWSGINLSDFYRSAGEGVQEPLSKITTILRADRNLEATHARIIEQLVRSAYEELRKRDGET